MRLVRFSFLLLIALGATLRSGAQATWNAGADFTTGNGNPNGVWTYGWMDTGFTTFTPYVLANASVPGLGGSPLWYSTIGGDSTPSIWLNTSASTYFGISPGQISLHPGPGNQPSVLRWTAPAGLNGTVNVDGQFFAGDTGGMQVAVRQGGAVLWNASDAGAFSFALGIAPGDTLDFAVFGGYVSGNTGLTLTLTAVPEPAGCAALGGIVVLGWGGWRRRRRGVRPAGQSPCVS